MPRSCSWLFLPAALNTRLPAAAPDVLLLPNAPQVFRTAVELKQRRLVTECLVLLLPQFGRSTSDSTGEGWVGLCARTLQHAQHGTADAGSWRLRLVAAVQLRSQACCLRLRSELCSATPAVAAVVDLMDATLSKVVLTQVGWLAGHACKQRGCS